MTWLGWLFALGAVWRLTLLAVADHVTQPVRDRIESRFPSPEVAYLLGCPWCASIYIAPVVIGSGLAWSDGWAWQLAAGSLTASAVTGLLASYAAPDD